MIGLGCRARSQPALIPGRSQVWGARHKQKVSPGSWGCKHSLGCCYRSDECVPCDLFLSTNPADTLTSLVIAIPIRLLWKVKIRFLQKCILGFSLCLSFVMCVVAIVRISGLPSKNQIDATWGVFWQQIEACVAVLLVSFTAFRSFFISAQNKRAPKKAPPISGQVSRRRPFNWGNPTGVRLPTIPSATLTGLRTFIRGGPRRESVGSTLDESVQLTSRGISNLEAFPEATKVASTSTCSGAFAQKADDDRQHQIIISMQSRSSEQNIEASMMCRNIQCPARPATYACGFVERGTSFVWVLGNIPGK